MSTLEKLIAQLCPDGVEYKQMGKVAKVCRGVRVVKAQLSKVGKYPVYQNSITPLGYHLERNCKAGTTFVIAAGAAGEIGYCNVDFWAADDCYYIETDKNLNGRFVYYCLLTMRLQLTSKVRKASVPRLARSFVDNLVIPFPPLPVQKEIVRMLDDMAGLIDALEEELAARKQQYEWCRERLLTFGDDVERKGIGLVCEILRGKRLTKNELSDENSYPIFHGGIAPIGYYNKPNRDANTVMVINVGASAGTVGFVSTPFWSSDGCFCLKQKRDLESKYLYYILKTNESKIRAKIRVAGIPTLDANVVKNMPIPIPALPVQKKIVSKLDDMTALIDFLEEELAARKQQYEYYRDKLLTFTRKPEVA